MNLSKKINKSVSLFNAAMAKISKKAWKNRATPSMHLANPLNAEQPMSNEILPGYSPEHMQNCYPTVQIIDC